MNNYSHCLSSENSGFIFLALFLFIFLVSADARGNLSGSIGGMTFSAQNNPYVVNGNLTVPEGEHAVIGEGVHFFFRPFTGIMVYGNLSVHGTAEHPVHFTAINDTLSPEKSGDLPNPFDWNGIMIDDMAGSVDLFHFILSYSVYGIKSQKASIAVRDARFFQNGLFHFAIGESIQRVVENVPFNYETHTVTYDANGATSGAVPQDAERYRQNDIVEVLENSGYLTKKGSVFSGWNSSFDGNGGDYACGENFIMNERNVTLFAKWKSMKTDRLSHSTDQLNKLRKSAFSRKGIPVTIGASGILTAIATIWQAKLWNDLESKYHSELSIPRQRRMASKGRALSTGAVLSGTYSLAALSIGIIRFIRSDTVHNKQQTVPSTLLIDPLLHGMRFSVSVPIQVPFIKECRFEKHPLPAVTHIDASL